MIALSVMWISSGQTSVQHLVMLQRPMPSSSLSIRVRDFASKGCISSAATRTKNRGPPNFSIWSCSRRTWHTFWHKKHSIHLRNSCTRPTSAWYIFQSVPGRGSNGGIFFLTPQFQETTGTQSLVRGAYVIGLTENGLSIGDATIHTLQVSRCAATNS